MKLENINSGSDYAEQLIAAIIKNEDEANEDQKTPETLLKFWFKNIRELAEQTYLDYITGKREHFIFSDVELMDLYNKAGEAYVGELLDGMHEKGILDLSIGEGGEFYYGLSEEGKKIAEQFKQQNGE